LSAKRSRVQISQLSFYLIKKISTKQCEFIQVSNPKSFHLRWRDRELYKLYIGVLPKSVHYSVEIILQQFFLILFNCIKGKVLVDIFSSSWSLWNSFTSLPWEMVDKIFFDLNYFDKISKSKTYEKDKQKAY
jgi:hypothetical protein